MRLFRRYKTPVSLIVLDIDRFKKVNDKFGHDAGDELIKTLAKTVAKCLRETDMLARYGGDEFVILLSNTRRKGAMTLAEHIRQKVADSVAVSEEMPITVSLGVATIKNKDGGSDLFTRADQALLLAKKEGRNRAQFANVSR